MATKFCVTSVAQTSDKSTEQEKDFISRHVGGGEWAAIRRETILKDKSTARYLHDLANAIHTTRANQLVRNQARGRSDRKE